MESELMNLTLENSEKAQALIAKRGEQGPGAMALWGGSVLRFRWAMAREESK